MAANRQLRRARLAALLGAQAATAARDAEGLSITGLRAVRVREPVSRRSYTVVRLEIRSGLTGFGECGAVADTALQRARAIVVGKTATAYEVLSRALADLGEVEAAVIMALLDVVGRHAKAPVYQILGGPTRHKIRAMTTLEGDSDRALVAALRRAPWRDFAPSSSRCRRSRPGSRATPSFGPRGAGSRHAAPKARISTSWSTAAVGCRPVMRRGLQPCSSRSTRSGSTSPAP